MSELPEFVEIQHDQSIYGSYAGVWLVMTDPIKPEDLIFEAAGMGSYIYYSPQYPERFLKLRPLGPLGRSLSAVNLHIPRNLTIQVRIDEGPFYKLEKFA